MRTEQTMRIVGETLGMIQELGTSTASDLGSLSIPDSISLTSVEEVEAAEKELEQPTVFTNMVSKSRFSRLYCTVLYGTVRYCTVRCCSFDSH